MTPEFAVFVDGLPNLPLPKGPCWEAAASLLNQLQIQFRVLDWKTMRSHPGFAQTEGGPYAAFFFDGTLYVSPLIGQQGLAHEVGHCVVWHTAGRPAGFNYSIDYKNADKVDKATYGTWEEDACCVEVYLLTKHTDLDPHTLIRDHYGIGIIINYDPDDDQYDEDLGEYLGEAPYAWEEWREAVRMGETILQEL